MKKQSKIRSKFNFWFFNFHKEVMKTSAIGKKMLTASRTSTHLKDSYEELGKLLEKGVENGEIDWDSPKMRALIHTIKACKRDLEDIEIKMNKIKFHSIELKKEDTKKD